MPSLVLRVLLTLLAVGICAQSLEDVEELESICGMDSVLRCNAKSKCTPGVQYRAVRWYKVSEEPSHKLNGLLARNLSPPNSVTRWYTGLEREVQLLDDSLDILLPNVTSEDSGKYRCFLAAPVGEQNQMGDVHLRVAGCPDNKSTDQSERGDIFLLLAMVLLVVALLIFTISYITLKNVLIQRNKRNPQEPLLDAPLEKKDLILIYTLGSNWEGKAAKVKHFCV